MNIFYPDNDKRSARVHELQTQIGVILENCKHHISEIKNLINTLGQDYVIPVQTTEYANFILSEDNENKNLSAFLNKYRELAPIVEDVLSASMLVMPILGLALSAIEGSADRDKYRDLIAQLFHMRTNTKLCLQNLNSKHTHMLAILKALKVNASSKNPLVITFPLDKANEKIRKALQVDAFIEQEVQMSLIEQDRQDGSYTEDDPI